MTRIAMPVARCHSMWQWKNQNPGLSASHCTTRPTFAGDAEIVFLDGIFVIEGLSIILPCAVGT